jgi:hypothetical protein
MTCGVQKTKIGNGKRILTEKKQPPPEGAESDLKAQTNIYVIVFIP